MTELATLGKHGLLEVFLAAVAPILKLRFWIHDYIKHKVLDQSMIRLFSYTSDLEMFSGVILIISLLALQTSRSWRAFRQRFALLQS